MTPMTALHRLGVYVRILCHGAISILNDTAVGHRAKLHRSASLGKVRLLAVSFLLLLVLVVSRVNKATVVSVDAVHLRVLTHAHLADVVDRVVQYSILTVLGRRRLVV